MTISDAIILVTWIGCNLQTRHKITNRYPIPDSAATILISNIVRVCYARYIRLKKDTIMEVRDSDTVYRLDREWIPDFVCQVLYALLTELFQICWGDMRFEFLASSWWSRDLSTIYRPDRRWAPDFVSQVLYGLLTTSFVRYVRMTEELHSSHHRDGHIIIIQNLQARLKVFSTFSISSFTCTFDLKTLEVIITRDIVNSYWG